MLSYAQFETGQTPAPFQYRALTAWILQAAHRYLPSPESLVRHLPPVMQGVESFTLVLIAFVSVAGACFIVRLALRHLTSDDEVWSDWGSLLVIPMCYYHYLLAFGHPCCTPLQLPYDLPSVAFFAVAIWLVVTKQDLWLYPVIALSTLNRESTVFLILLLALYRSGEMSPQELRSKKGWQLAANCIALGTVWIAMRVWLHHLYPNLQPTSGPHWAGFEIHVVDNIGYLLRPYYWTSFLSLFGFTWIFVYRYWREIPGAGLRRSLWIGPIYLVAMYVVGVLSEIRIFGELVPLFVIAFVMLLREMLKEHTIAAV
jgi:hypothetical protein